MELPKEQIGRTCTRCGIWKPAAEFFEDKRRKYVGGTNGMFSRCKSCTSSRNKERRAANPERFREWERRSSAATFEVNGPKKRIRNLPHRLRIHGLTETEFWAMMAAQDNRCAICQRQVMPAREGKGNRDCACIDHDHETGKVRGILCNSCNTALGLLKDKTDVLLRAVEYLSK